MALCDQCFDDFLHPLIHELMDKNKRFRELYGLHNRWDWDDEAVTLTFSDPDKPTLLIDVTVVGSTEGDSWEWSWANPNYEARAKRDMEKVREFGEINDYEKLTSAFWDANEYTGWGMTAVAVHILKAPGAYRFPTENGHCYVIYREIEEIPKDADDLWGAMVGSVEIAPGADLTQPTGAVWYAETGGGKFSTNT